MTEYCRYNTKIQCDESIKPSDSCINCYKPWLVNDNSKRVDDDQMYVEELAKWLYTSHREHVIDGVISRIDWEDIHEVTKARWRNFAKAHKLVFHAGDKSDI